MNDSGETVYYYCDIINSEFQKEKNTWIFTDLLVDVKIYPGGFVEVVDVGEVAEAIDKLQKRFGRQAIMKGFLWEMSHEKD